MTETGSQRLEVSYEDTIEFVLMEDRREILDWWDLLAETPWSHPNGLEIAVGNVLAGGYQAVKGVINGETKGICIYQHQKGVNELDEECQQCFVIQILATGNLRKFRDEFYGILKENGVEKVQTTSAEKNVDAVERLFGMEYRYAVFEKEL